jgi:hypothetical protein
VFLVLGCGWSPLMAAWQAPDRPRAPQVPGDERASLDSWLAFHRATLLIKCAGLTADQLAARSCEPSRLPLLGLVRHMAEVEGWFHQFDGLPEVNLYYTDDHPDADFEDPGPRRADHDLAACQASIERSRAAVAGLSRDQISPDPSGEVSLRWICQHMIEEYARHNGHADLLRERIGGTTGS